MNGTDFTPADETIPDALDDGFGGEGTPADETDLDVLTGFEKEDPFAELVDGFFRRM
jgi:hypothetical protein